jgi:hypothetical protein
VVVVVADVEGEALLFDDDVDDAGHQHRQPHWKHV